jgi:hypothetical protein
MLCRCPADIRNMRERRASLWDFCHAPPREADMMDVAKLIEDHIAGRCNCLREEPDFADFLTPSDRFEAHGMGIVLEELMTLAELAEYQHSLG